MPFHVEVAARAKRDLEDIYQYIQAEQSQQAHAWFNGLYEALHSLGEMPERFPVIREDAALRHLLYGNKPHIYRVIYHVDDRSKQVTILTIRHGARAAFQPRHSKPTG